MYWVTSTDIFMSDWGLAKDRINKLIIECRNLVEAQIVFDNAKGREDQKNVRLCSARPALYRTTEGKNYVLGEYYVQIKTKEDMPPLVFRKGAFCEKEKEEIL